MKKFLPLSLLLGLVFIFSCTDYDDNLSGVQIRVRNSSDVNLDEVEVADLKYGEVATGVTTPYQELKAPQLGEEPVPLAISVTVDSLNYYELVDVEIDTIGLQLLTFQIDAASEGTGLEFKVLED